MENQNGKKDGKLKKTNCQKTEGKWIVFSTKVDECLGPRQGSRDHNT